jgi:predicted  nucleic acid-binding Zn-ribbon protein
MLLSTIIVVLIAVVGFHYLLSMSHERELNSLKKYANKMSKESEDLKEQVERYRGQSNHWHTELTVQLRNLHSCESACADLRQKLSQVERKLERSIGYYQSRIESLESHNNSMVKKLYDYEKPLEP